MNKLERYIIIAAACAIFGFLAWYFKTVLIYILVSAVVALIGRPLTRLLSSIKIKNFKFPNWLAAVISLITILGVAFSILLLISPLVVEIGQQLSALDVNSLAGQISVPLEKFNHFLCSTFPNLGDGFRIEIYIFNQLRELLSFSMFSGIISSVTSVLVDFAVAIFSICFISFFFMLKEGTFTNIITAILPDKYEERARRASSSISHLLTRYFLGISLESLCIATLNALGLIFIAKQDPTLALVIAFISGILNVIPYVGPLIGDAIAVLMGVFTYTSSGFGGSFILFLAVILGIFMLTQFIDNYVFQPVIYSNSVKSHPLEIFIVILMAGHISGILGMLIAIPTYTVLRVIAGEFLPNLKFVQQLTKNLKKE